MQALFTYETLINIFFVLMLVTQVKNIKTATKKHLEKQ